MGAPVVPDRGGHGEQSLGDAGEHSRWGAAAVAFLGQLAFADTTGPADSVDDVAKRSALADDRELERRYQLTARWLSLTTAFSVVYRRARFARR